MLFFGKYTLKADQNETKAQTAKYSVFPFNNRPLLTLISSSKAGPRDFAALSFV